MFLSGSLLGIFARISAKFSHLLFEKCIGSCDGPHIFLYSKATKTLSPRLPVLVRSGVHGMMVARP